MLDRAGRIWHESRVWADCGHFMWRRGDDWRMWRLVWTMVPTSSGQMLLQLPHDWPAYDNTFIRFTINHRTYNFGRFDQQDIRIRKGTEGATIASILIRTFSGVYLFPMPTTFVNLRRHKIMYWMLLNLMCRDKLCEIWWHWATLGGRRRIWQTWCTKLTSTMKNVASCATTSSRITHLT